MIVLDDWQRFAGERAPAHGELSGTLHVYCTVTAAQGIVPDLLARLRGTHPGIRIELATGYATDAIDRLRGGDIDVSIAALPDRLPPGIVSHVLTTTRIVLVGPMQGPLFDTTKRRPLDWSQIPLVLPAFGLARDSVNQWLTARGVVPVVYSELQGHEAILALVALGCGVGVVPRLVLEKTALRDQIVEIPVRPMLRGLRIGICVRDKSLSSPPVAAVWDLARGVQ